MSVYLCKKNGFTLVEIMVSLIILAMLAAGLFSVFISSRNLVARSKRRLYAAEIARREIERRRHLLRADNWSLFNPTGSWSVCNGTVYPNYTVECRIDPGPATTEDYRKFSVRVRWNEPVL